MLLRENVDTVKYRNNILSNITVKGIHNAMVKAKSPGLDDIPVEALKNENVS